MSIQNPPSFIDNPQFVTILESVSKAETTLHSSKIHDYHSRTGKALRNQLREQVGQLQRAMNDDKVAEIFSQTTDPERFKVYNLVNSHVNELNREIKQLDDEIAKAKPKWYQRLMFWKPFKREEMVHQLTSSKLTEAVVDGSKSFMNAKIDPQPQSIDERIRNLSVPGAWAMSKSGDDTFVLHVASEGKAKSITVKVTSDGYQVADKIFGSFEQVKQQTGATIHLTEKEAEQFPLRVKERVKEFQEVAKASGPNDRKALQILDKKWPKEGRFCIVHKDEERVAQLVMGSKEFSLNITDAGQISANGGKLYKDFSALKEDMLLADNPVGVEWKSRSSELIDRANMEIRTKVGAIADEVDQKNKETKVLPEIQKKMGDHSVGAGFIAVAENLGLSLVYIDKDQKVQPPTKIDVFPDKYVLGEKAYDSADQMIADLHLQPLRLLEENLKKIDAQAEKIHNASDPKSVDAAKARMQEGLDKLPSLPGRYLLAPVADKVNQWSLFVETGDKKSLEYNLSLTFEGEILLKAADGTIRATFDSFDKVKESVGSKDAPTVTKALDEHTVAQDEDTKMRIKAKKEDLVSKVVTRAPSQKAHFVDELIKIRKGLKDEAIGTAIILGDESSKELVIIEKLDDAPKSYQIDIQKDKIDLRDASGIRHSFESVDQLVTGLKIKEFDVMKRRHADNYQLIADANAMLLQLKECCKGLSDLKIQSEQQALDILYDAITYLGKGTDRSYLLFREGNETKLAYVMGKEVIVKTLDAESEPGKCLMEVSDGKKVDLLKNIPLNLTRQRITEGLKDFIANAAGAGIALSEKNTWAEDRQQLGEKIRGLHSDLVSQGATSKDKIEDLPNEFALHLGSLGADHCIGAYVITPGQSNEELRMRIVTKDETGAAVLKELVIDLKTNPGKIIVDGKEYTSVKELRDAMPMTKTIAKLREDRSKQKELADLLAGLADFDVRARSPKEAKEHLEQLLKGAKDAGVTRAYLFRASGGSEESASFMQGELGLWATLKAFPGTAKEKVTGLVDAAKDAVVGVAQRVPGASYVAAGASVVAAGATYLVPQISKFYQEKFGEAFSECFISTMRDSQFVEYKVLLRDGRLQYEGEYFNTLPEVFSAIKKKEGITDIASRSSLQSTHKGAKANTAVIEADYGYNGVGNKAWKGVKDVGSFVTSKIAIIPGVGQYVHQVLERPPIAESHEKAKELLEKVYDYVPENAYMTYQSAEKTQGGQLMYGLSIIKDATTQEAFIDVWSQPGKFRIVTKDGSEIASDATLNDAITKAYGKSEPFHTQWNEYLREKQKEEAPRLAIEAPPVTPSTAVSGEVGAKIETGEKYLKSLRDVYDIREGRKVDSELDKTIKRLLDLYKKATTAKGKSSNSQKLLRIIFGITESASLADGIKKPLKDLQLLIHQDKQEQKPIEKAKELREFINELIGDAKLEE